jgi:prevent-host-death family protein
MRFKCLLGRGLMGIITAKQLKQKTGEVIKKVRSGERLTVTYRGKPVAVIVPSTQKEQKALEELRSFDDAWKDIEETLQKTKPKFKDWREATEWMRNRT